MKATTERKDSSMALSVADKAYVQGYRAMKGIPHDKEALAEIIDYHRKASRGPATAGPQGRQAAPAGGES
jgi:hypothetical protein